MSLDGGLEEVEESFFNRAISAFQLVQFSPQRRDLAGRDRRLDQLSYFVLRERPWHSIRDNRFIPIAQQQFRPNP